MLFSPYFPIRFKGVFIAYLYIHIPHIFPTGFFEEFKRTATLISKKIRSRGSVVKRHPLAEWTKGHIHPNDIAVRISIDS